MELAFVHARPRDLWRRLRFVVDQCRAWEEAGGTTLREYLAWVRLQSAEGARVIETVLPETDDEAVRILTVHGAKGLEFPITVLSGMTTQLDRAEAASRCSSLRVGGWALRLKKDLETAEFAEYLPIEEQMDHHERLRLLYVAATRARDHLIVSVHRKDGVRVGFDGCSAAVRGGVGSGAGGGAGAGGQSWCEGVAASAPVAGVVGPDLPSFEEWERQRSAAMASASRPVAVSATRLAEEAARALQARSAGRRAEGPARHRPASLAERSLRQRHRPGGPWRAADRRSGHRRWTR